MKTSQKGFTLIEILVVVTIIGVLAGLVVVLIPKGQFEAKKTECMNNVRNIVGLITTGGDIPKKWGGCNLILYLVPRGDLEGDDSLKLLFCPGDPEESYDAEAYASLQLDKKGEDYSHLTSYAGRDQENRECRAMSGSTKQVILICDDSENHHDNKGFVVGFTSGAAKFRHKFDDWKKDVKKETVKVGQDSTVEELKCLKID